MGECQLATIELRNISKSFGAATVLRDINLTVGDGEFVVFVGPSGCGKSTLLRLIAGLEPASSGAIRIDGKDVTHEAPAKRKLAMVFQSYALYPHMTVARNIAFPLKMLGEPRETIERKVAEAARTLNLTDYLQRRPAQLSGGQRQRVAIGRAIVREPVAFLFDEPLSNLDAALRGAMRLELTELHNKLGTTMIYVTHDQVEAMTMADKIVVLDVGRVEQVGSPLELYRKPSNLLVAGFIGSPKMNFVDGAAVPQYDAKTIGVRPEHIAISTVPSQGAWAGQVSVIEHLGADTFAHVRVPGIGNINVRGTGDLQVAHGDHVFLVPQPSKIVRFDAGGLALN